MTLIDCLCATSRVPPEAATKCAPALAFMDEHVRELFGNASADQYSNRLRLERARSCRGGYGAWRGAALFAAGRLGLANGRGAAAFRCTAIDPRDHRRIPWPTLSDREP